MTFEVPPSKASIGQDEFKFTIGGDEFAVRKLKYLPIGTRADIGDDSDALLEFFAPNGTKQGDAVRGLDAEQFEALTTAWQKDSDVTLGESEASAS